MSASGIVMMLIACIGLWGGCVVSLVIMNKHNKMSAKEVVEAIEDAEPETAVDK